MRTSRRRSLPLLLLLSMLAACGDDGGTGPGPSKRAFAFSHIAGLPADSGYVCPPPAAGAVARIFVGGDGAEMLPDGRFWLNLAVSRWERYPSSAQSADNDLYNEVGRWAADGDTLTLTQLSAAPVLGKARVAGDSLALRIITSCPSEIDLLELTLIYKELTP